MSPKIEVKREPLIAQSTFELLLSSMHKLMPLQLGVVQEPFITTWHWTYVLSLPVSHLVLLQ